jgi:hypothetical protein
MLPVPWNDCPLMVAVYVTGPLTLYPDTPPVGLQMNPTPHNAGLGLEKLPVIVVAPDVIVNVALNLIVQGGLRIPDNEKLPVSENEPGYGPVAFPLTLKPIEPLSLRRLEQLPDVDPPVDLPTPVSPSPVSGVTAAAADCAPAARRTMVAKAEMTANPLRGTFIARKAGKGMADLQLSNAIGRCADALEAKRPNRMSAGTPGARSRFTNDIACAMFGISCCRAIANRQH